MKLVDITKCHEDSPDFRASLSHLEDSTNYLEKRLKLIASLCEEKRSLNEKERAVTQRLIREFDLISSNDLNIADQQESDAAVNSVEVITTALKQLIDNQERMFEQINIGIERPLKHFLTHDLEQVKASKKAYYKAYTEAQQVTEKFGQCKKHESHLMNEISLQLFDVRTELHKATCTYTLDLNLLHAKRTPDFLNEVVDFMMSQLSFFHLGHVTVKDTEPHITTLYSILEKLRKEVTSRDTQQRSQAQELIEEVLYKRSQNLLHFHTYDLHNSLDNAKNIVRQHISKSHSNSLALEKWLDLPATVSSDSTRTKSGFMWYAEPRTFGIHWIRLYFHIKNSMLLSEATAKIKVPISLNLNLCNVKPAEVNDTERNFSFKVTSPLRVLLLQAESSLEMQDWLTILNNAIAHAIHGAPSVSPGDNVNGTTSTSGSSMSTDIGDEPTDLEPMPIKPPRRKSNASKELYSIPGNEVCADCGGSRPKWASVNLGVLICIECSGIHRSMGVYISQVRSLTLDSIKATSIQRIKTIGNTKANAVYEALLPENFDRLQVKKGHRRKEFIIEKYVHMQYVTETDKERILKERKEVRAESLRKSGYTSIDSGDTNNSMTTCAESANLKVEDKVETRGSKENLTATKVEDKVKIVREESLAQQEEGCDVAPEESGSVLGQPNGKASPDLPNETPPSSNT